MNALAALRSRVLLLALAFGLWPALAFGQSANVSANPPAYGSGSRGLSQTPSGGLRSQLQDGAGNDVSSSHPLPISGSFSASLAGFTPTAGATANVADIVNTSQDVALPSGTDAVVTNQGTVDVKFRIQVGAGTAVSTDQTLKAGAATGIHVGTATHLSVIAPTGTGTGTTAGQLNIQGGSGLAAGYGGGGSSGGGSSGAVFGPTAAGSAAANPPVLTGGTIDGTGTGNVSVQKVVAGVAFDNTAQVNGVTVLTGAGATGTGSPRDTVAQDTSTVAGAAPLTTGLYVTGPSAAALATSALQTTGNTSLGTIATASAAQATAANQTSVIGTKAPGTAAASSLLAGGVYTSAGVSLTTGQQAALQLDSTGHLLTTATGGGGGAVFGPTAVGSAAANPPILIGGTPTGSATGNVTLTAVKPASTAPLATDPALVVSISPNSVNANGQTTMSASAPVTIASDQSAVAVGVTNSSGAHQAVIGCDSSIVYDASTNGSTQLVALSSGKSIYVCGYTLFSAGTVNVELDYGTGTACVTSPTKIVPAFQLTAQTGAVDPSTFYRGLKTAASNELCLKTSAGVAVQGIVYYTQF